MVSHRLERTLISIVDIQDINYETVHTFGVVDAAHMQVIVERMSTMHGRTQSIVYTGSGGRPQSQAEGDYITFVSFTYVLFFSLI